MKVLLAPVGTRGDVQPLLFLGRELKARGHEVLVAAPDNDKAFVEQLGLPWLRGGRDFRAIMEKHGNRVANPSTLTRLARELVDEQCELFEAAARGVDVVVPTALAIGAIVAAELVGARCVGVAYVPGLLATSTIAPVLLQKLGGMPHVVNGWLWTLQRKLINATILKPLNVFRVKRGLKPVDDVLDFATDLPAVVAAFDECFVPRPPEWGPHINIVGFMRSAEVQPLPDEVERFLNSGDPPIYVGFGSMISDDADVRFREIVGAASRVHKRVIVSSGWAGIKGDADRERVLVVGALDHNALFPRCAVVVHHGGAGTLATATRAAVPQVIVPHLFDQHDWARRAYAAGVAPRPLATRFSARDLAQAVETAATLGGKAREVAARLRLDGTQRAADIIERTMGVA